MKKICILLLFVLLLSAGCVNESSTTIEDVATNHAQQDAQFGQEYEMTVSEVYNALRFSSFENFLLAQQAAREGRDIEEFVARWDRGGDANSLADVVEQLKFVEVDDLFLPTQIPAGYAAFRIDVIEHHVSIDYLPYERIAELEVDNMLSFLREEFNFAYSRDDDHEDILGGDPIDGWIDRKYKFSDFNNTLTWIENGRDFMLSAPIAEEESSALARGQYRDPLEPTDALRALGFDTVEDFARTMTQLREVDLTDEVEVEALLEELREGGGVLPRPPTHQLVQTFGLVPDPYIEVWLDDELLYRVPLDADNRALVPIVGGAEIRVAEGAEELDRSFDASGMLILWLTCCCDDNVIPPDGR